MCVNRLAGLASTGGGGQGKGGGPIPLRALNRKALEVCVTLNRPVSMRGNIFGGVHMGFLEMSTGVHSTLLPP